MASINDLSHFYLAIQGYVVSDQAVDSGDSNVNYYGYVNRYGNWYILKEDTVNLTYRYAKGDSGYTTAWNARESAVYDYYHNVFK